MSFVIIARLRLITFQATERCRWLPAASSDADADKVTDSVNQGLINSTACGVGFLLEAGVWLSLPDALRYQISMRKSQTSRPRNTKQTIVSTMLQAAMATRNPQRSNIKGNRTNMGGRNWSYPQKVDTVMRTCAQTLLD